MGLLGGGRTRRFYAGNGAATGVEQLTGTAQGVPETGL